MCCVYDLANTRYWRRVGRQKEIARSARSKRPPTHIPSYCITSSPFLSIAFTISLSISFAFLRAIGRSAKPDARDKIASYSCCINNSSYSRWSILESPFLKPLISSSPFFWGSSFCHSCSMRASLEFWDSGMSMLKLFSNPLSSESHRGTVIYNSSSKVPVGGEDSRCEGVNVGILCVVSSTLYSRTQLGEDVCLC